MNITDLIFPKKCIYCKKQGEYICSSCFSNLEIVFRNNIKGKTYDSFIYLDNYKNKTRNNLINIKFNYKTYILNGFVEIIFKNERIIEYLKELDYITFVPMTKKKEARRGFNQSKYLAQKLSNNFKIPCIEAILKTKKNKTQSLLKRKERFANVKDVYKVNDSFVVKGKSFVLVDDIYTTGATIDECSRVLKQKGAKRICILVIAKD